MTSLDSASTAPDTTQFRGGGATTPGRVHQSMVNDSALAAAAAMTRCLMTLDGADRARQARDFQTAETGYRELLSEFTLMGSPPVPMARTLAGLAVCADVAHRKDEAVAHYEEAVKLYATLESSAHWATHTALLNNLAILYRSLDRPAAAEACYVRAINKHESMNELGLGEQLIMLYSNLACLYYKMGLFDAAIWMGSRALDLREKEPSPDRTRHFELLRSLGIFCILGGCSADGIRHLERARDVVKKIIPPNHEATIELLVNLGSAYMDAGRVTDAMLTLEEAALLLIGTKGSSDLLLAHIHTNIGYLHLRAGRCDKAYESHRKALGILNAHPAADDSARAEANHNLAVVCEALKRPQQSAAHRRAAMELLVGVADETRHKIAHAAMHSQALPVSSATLVDAERLFVRMPVTIEAGRKSGNRLTPPLRTETIEFDL